MTCQATREGTQQVSSCATPPINRYASDKMGTSATRHMRNECASTLLVKGKPRRATRKQKKHGGWKTTSGMSYADAKSIKDGIHVLKTAGVSLNYFVSIHPPSNIHEDQNRKVSCRRKIDIIRRRLLRNGCKFIALIVYEKALKGCLHVHLLLHIPKGFGSLLEGYHALPEVDVRPTKRQHETYILKSRLPLNPEIEISLRALLPRVKAAPFRGRRWSWTTDAKTYLNTKGG